MTIRRVTRILVVALILVGLFIFVLVLTAPWAVRHFRIQERFHDTIRQEFGYDSSFKRFTVSLLPSPKLHFHDFILEDPEGSTDVPVLKAGRVAVRPRLLSILSGHFDLAHVSATDAQVHYPWRDQTGSRLKTVSLSDVTLDIWNVRPNEPINFDLNGKWIGEAENLHLTGTIQSDFKNLDLLRIAADVEISIGPIAASDVVRWWSSLPFLIKDGTLSLNATLSKAENESTIQVAASAGMENFVYALAEDKGVSLSGNYQGTLSGKADLNTRAIEIIECEITTPFGGPFEVNAQMNISDWSIEEFLIQTEKLQLDLLPQYILSMADIVPLNLGFSGESKMNLFAKGKPEQLTLNTRVDLTDTTLSYAKYFSKPSGIPFLTRGELMLVGGLGLRGDFTIEFEGASLKGSIVGIDLSSGQGEATVLTNKFSVDGWGNHFPLFRDFQLSGQSKLLASARGDLRNLQETQLMVNVTLDGLTARLDEETAIENLHGSIDVGPVDSEFKDIRFDLGGSAFQMEGKTFGRPERRTLMTVQSESMVVPEVIRQLRTFDEVLDLESVALDWDKIESAVGRIISDDVTIGQLDAQIALTEKKLIVPKLEFEAHDGHWSIESLFDFTGEQPSSHVQLVAKQLSLADLRVNAEGPLLDGKLATSFTLDGGTPFAPSFFQDATGSGVFTITNGELHSVDILGGLGSIAELAVLGRFKSGSTRFSDIGGSFSWEEEKLRTENLLLISDDFHVEGAGEIGLEGNLNFRLSVFLSTALSQRVASELSEGMRLGPIPLLLVGTIRDPMVKTDPLLIQAFLENLVRDQFLTITSGFLPAFRDRIPLIGAATTLKTDAGDEGSGDDKSGMEQTLAESGFSLLEQFLAGTSSGNSAEEENPKPVE